MMRYSVRYSVNKVPRCASEPEQHRLAVAVVADRAAGKRDRLAGIPAAFHGRLEPAARARSPITPEHASSALYSHLLGLAGWS